MWKFFSFLTTNWIGLLIGLGVAIIICLILGLTVLKSNVLARSIIFIIVTILFTLSGAAIQQKFFYKSILNPELNPDLNDGSLEHLDADKYTHITSDSGFDRTYIEENRPLAEICEDKFADLNLVEYKDVIIFSFDKVINGIKYTPNIIMRKSNNMTVFDGCFNVKLKYCKFWINDYSLDFYFEPTSTMLKEKEPIYYSDFQYGDNFTNKNFESQIDNGYKYFGWQHPVLPRFYRMTKQPDINALCCHDFWQSLTTNTSIWAKTKMAKSAEQLCYALRETLFEQIGDLTIMLNQDAISSSMDTVYFDMFNSVKGSASGQYSLDVTKHFYYYDTVKIEEKDIYVLYNNKCIINLNYTNKSDKNCFKSDKDDSSAIDDSNSRVPVDSEKVEKTNQIVLKLINKNNRDLTGFEPKSAPVSITLINRNDNTKKYTYIFDSMLKINDGLKCGILTGEYDVKIESNVLDIGDFAFLKVDKSKIVNIDFDYQYGTIVTSVRLRPLSNFDYTNLDLKENPVIITFINGNLGYNFTFDTVESLNEILTKRIPMGKYKWSITSNELAFKEKSGNLVVSSNNYEFIFNFDYKTNVEYGIIFNKCNYGSKAALNLGVKFIIKDNCIISSLIKSVKLYLINSTGSLQIVDLVVLGNEFTREILLNVLEAGTYNFSLSITMFDNSIITTNNFVQDFKFQDNGQNIYSYVFDIVQVK